MAQPATLIFAASRSALRWLIHLGGPSLILIGLADNSLIPLPGSTDIVTILLSAHRRDLWFYYGIMATAGSVIGGYVTYTMARRGGKKTLERRFSKARVSKVYTSFERWGFAAVAIPAILPPPFPIVPMLLAAGALQYPARKFLVALGSGRGVRYTILALLGAHYGHSIVWLFGRYNEPAIIVLIGLAVAGAVFALIRYVRWRESRGQGEVSPQSRDRRAA